jgi:hypothetical protein
MPQKQKQLELQKRKKKRLQSYRSTEKTISYRKINDFSNKTKYRKDHTLHKSHQENLFFFPAIRPLSDFFFNSQKRSNPFYKKPNQSYIKP